MYCGCKLHCRNDEKFKNNEAISWNTLKEGENAGDLIKNVHNVFPLTNAEPPISATL